MTGVPGSRVIGLLVGTLSAVIFIVLGQLNFAIAPRLGFLHQIGFVGRGRNRR